MKSIRIIYCLLLACLFACSGKSSPSDIAVESTEAWVNGDTEEYFEYMSITEEERKDLEAFMHLKGDDLIKKYKDRGGIENIEVIREDMSKDEKNCRVTVEITFKDGSREKENVKLENIDDNWYVINPLGEKD